jgi:hypothetical protein
MEIIVQVGGPEMTFERVGLIENGSYRLLDHHVSENRMAEAASIGIRIPLERLRFGVERVGSHSIGKRWRALIPIIAAESRVVIEIVSVAIRGLDFTNQRRAAN